jgi:hypothetical protein
VAELRHMPATMQDSAQDRRWLPRPAVGRRVMPGGGWQPGESRVEEQRRWRGVDGCFVRRRRQVRLCLGAERIRAGWRRCTGCSGNRRCTVTAESSGMVLHARAGDWRGQLSGVSVSG